MRLWTTQLGQWRLAKQKDIPLINTTVMSGLFWLAPSWEMVKGHKLGIFTDSDYTERFIPMMQLSMVKHRDLWLELIRNDTVAIACYCKAGAFCHRVLLVELIRVFCEQEGIEFSYLGELTKETA